MSPKREYGSCIGLVAFRPYLNEILENESDDIFPASTAASHHSVPIYNEHLDYILRHKLSIYFGTPSGVPVYDGVFSHPLGGVFPSSIAEQPRGCQYRTIRLSPESCRRIYTSPESSRRDNSNVDFFWHRYYTSTPTAVEIEHGEPGV